MQSWPKSLLATYPLVKRKTDARNIFKKLTRQLHSNIFIFDSYEVLQSNRLLWIDAFMILFIAIEGRNDNRRVLKVGF